MDDIYIRLSPEKAQLLLDVLMSVKPPSHIKQIFHPGEIEIAIRKARPIRNMEQEELHPLLKQYHKNIISFEDKRSLFRHIWEYRRANILDSEDIAELHSMKEEGWLGTFYDDE